MSSAHSSSPYSDRVQLVIGWISSALFYQYCSHQYRSTGQSTNHIPHAMDSKLSQDLLMLNKAPKDFTKQLTNTTLLFLLNPGRYDYQGELSNLVSSFNRFILIFISN